MVWQASELAKRRVVCQKALGAFKRSNELDEERQLAGAIWRLTLKAELLIYASLGSLQGRDMYSRKE